MFREQVQSWEHQNWFQTEVGADIEHEDGIDRDEGEPQAVFLVSNPGRTMRVSAKPQEEARDEVISLKDAIEERNIPDQSLYETMLCSVVLSDFRKSCRTSGRSFD